MGVFAQCLQDLWGYKVGRVRNQEVDKDGPEQCWLRYHVGEFVQRVREVGGGGEGEENAERGGREEVTRVQLD